MKKIIKENIIINVNDDDENVCKIIECPQYEYNGRIEIHFCSYFRKEIKMGKYGRIYRCQECLNEECKE